MRAYIARRLLLIIPILLLVSILVFLTVRFIPGDVVDLLQDQLGEEQIDREAVRHALGLDVPVHIQYLRWVAGIVTRGDLGTSLYTNRPVIEEILNRLPVSLELGVLGILAGLVIAIPVGVYSAVRQDTWGDYTGRSLAIAAIAVPSFWLGTMVMIYPSIWWNWAPSMEYIPFVENPPGNLVQFIIPAVILGMALAGTTMRMTRTMMLEVLRQDYIRTAWSKGLPERLVLMRHALKNALMPVVTIIGLQIPYIIGGVVIIEQIFVLPGVGRLVLDALLKRDYPMVSGINLVLAGFVLITNLAVDLTYGYLDPRVQYK